MTLSEVITDFCERLAHAELRYLIGGSVASGVWGEPRQTNDVDLEIWLNHANKARFLEACQPPYYASAKEVDESIDLRHEYRIVQVLQMDEVLKFDCFLQGLSPIDEDAYAHAVMTELEAGHPIRVACAEHILVQKLRWYEAGNRVSERQWRDILSVARVTAALNWELVGQWCGLLGLEDTLAELRCQT